MLSPQEQKHDDRRLDVAKVDPEPVGGANLAGRKLVADEQVVDDPLHFAGVEQNRAAPPGLKREEALLLGVDLGIDVVFLGPKRVRRIELLEIGDEVRAVELAGAEVAGKARSATCRRACRRDSASGSCRGRRPNRRAASPRRRIGPMRSGRIAAVIMVCQPAWQLAMTIGLPSASGCRAGDLFDKRRFCAADVLDRLTRHRLGREADEVAGMAGADRDADLAVGLHAADAGPMAGARIDDDDRRLRRIDNSAFGRNDADKPIIGRARQLAPVKDELDSRSSAHSALPSPLARDGCFPAHSEPRGSGCSAATRRSNTPSLGRAS